MVDQAHEDFWGNVACGVDHGCAEHFNEGIAEGDGVAVGHELCGVGFERRHFYKTEDGVVFGSEVVEEGAAADVCGFAKFFEGETVESAFHGELAGKADQAGASLSFALFAPTILYLFRCTLIHIVHFCTFASGVQMFVVPMACVKAAECRDHYLILKSCAKVTTRTFVQVEDVFRRSGEAEWI